MRRIFGIGWAKTGTTTLGECFRILGFDHQTQRLDLVPDLGRGDLAPILAVAREKETFEDWPWLLLYRQLDEAFPGSLFVLTERAPEPWLRSYRNMLRRQGRASKRMSALRSILYGLPFPQVTDAQLLERYVRHNQEVRAYFRDRPRDLRVLNWEAGDGWSQLCAFVGREVPSVPFPHANRGTYARRVKPL